MICIMFIISCKSITKIGMSILTLLCSVLIVTFSDEMELWYDAPPLSVLSNIQASEVMKDDTNWLQALPLGNGLIGAMVYGGINLERIQLNEKSLWSGSFSESDNDKAPANLVRNILFLFNYQKSYVYCTCVHALQRN